MKKDKSTLGQRIYELRKEKKMTQGALAKQAGVSVAEICRLENGERKNPSMQLVVNILKELNVSNEEFLECVGYNQVK